MIFHGRADDDIIILCICKVQLNKVQKHNKIVMSSVCPFFSILVLYLLSLVHV